MEKNIEVWDLSEFEIDNSPHKLRGSGSDIMKAGKKTTPDVAGNDSGSREPQVLWEMMNRRWDIEENGFHQLKNVLSRKNIAIAMQQQK